MLRKNPSGAAVVLNVVHLELQIGEEETNDATEMQQKERRLRHVTKDETKTRSIKSFVFLR